MFYEWEGLKHVWLKLVIGCIIQVTFIHAHFCKMYNMQLILYLVEQEIKMMLLFIEKNFFYIFIKMGWLGDIKQITLQVVCSHCIQVADSLRQILLGPALSISLRKVSISLTLAAPMQISLKKRNFLHEKKVQSSQGYLVHLCDLGDCHFSTYVFRALKWLLRCHLKMNCRESKKRPGSDLGISQGVLCLIRMSVKRS